MFWYAMTPRLYAYAYSSLEQKKQQFASEQASMSEEANSKKELLFSDLPFLSHFWLE